MLTQTFAARYPITILGRDYAPGDTIADPAIAPKVLSRLADNHRIGVKTTVLAGPPEPDQPEPQPAASPGNDPVAAATGTVAPTPPTGDLTLLVRRWRERHAKAKPGSNLKGFLLETCRANKVVPGDHATAADLIVALQAAGVSADGADA